MLVRMLTTLTALAALTLYGLGCSDNSQPDVPSPAATESAQEEAAKAKLELEKVQAPQRQLVAEHAEAMHAGLLELMPNSCWSPVPADSAAKPCAR